ncbi:hypothetical protein H1R20_g8017, partial [Candolleomyces eurysporus]
MPQPDRSLRPTIYHWSSTRNSLYYWNWPSYPCGRRVPPDELESYMLAYICMPPSCLCAFVDNDVYTPSKISLVEAINENKESQRHRPYIGEYVAECASEDSCGYFVVLERFYTQKVLATMVYKKRDKPLDPHMWDFLKDEEDQPLQEEVASGFRRMMAGSCEEFAEATTETTDLFHTLEFDGLKASQFWELFIECASCQHVMPRHLYPYSHRCSKRTRDSDTTDAVPEEDSEGEEPKGPGAEVDEPAGPPTATEVGGAGGGTQQFTRARAIDELREIVRHTSGHDTADMEVEDIMNYFSELMPEDDPREDIIELLRDLR